MTTLFKVRGIVISKYSWPAHFSLVDVYLFMAKEIVNVRGPCNACFEKEESDVCLKFVDVF